MLDIITICDRGDNANTYVVGNDEEVIIIDPANRLSNITTAVKNRKVFIFADILELEQNGHI